MTQRDEELWRKTWDILREAPALEHLRSQLARVYEEAVRLGPGHGVEAATALKFLAGADVSALEPSLLRNEMHQALLRIAATDPAARAYLAEFGE